MLLIDTVLAAFSMFTALPVPGGRAWNERATRYILCAFPLTGTLCALSWLLWGAVCARFAIPSLLRGAVFAVLPHVVTGGIHLDGYMDTSDALASHADAERKQEILRDPHCGAFAVIRVCIYIVVYTALCASVNLSGRALRALCLSFLLSRALSGLMLTRLPVAEQSSLARMFTETDMKKRTARILTVWVIGIVIFLFYFHGIFGIAACASAAVVLACYTYTAKHVFRATSGDLAGWFLVKAEFWMLAAVYIAQLFVTGGSA